MKSKRRRQRYRGKGNATEIKLHTFIQQDRACKLGIAPANTANLYAEQNFASNILGGIIPGVGYGSRVGNKIYVMSISIRMLIYSCPSDDSYAVGTFLSRHIWHNQRSATGVTLPGFFRQAAIMNFHSYVDRKAVTVHKDKTFRVQAFESTTNLDGYFENVGAVRQITYSIPVNRYVTYTLDGDVKEDYNVYSLAILTATPGMNIGHNGEQIGCYQAQYTVYYKDA